MQKEKDYTQYSKQELIDILRSKDHMLETLTKENKETERLKFDWAGNLGHWYWDLQSNKVTFNPLKVTNLGYKESEIPENCDYKFFTDKLHPEDFELVMQNMRDHLSGKSAAYEVEYRIQTKSGNWRWYYDRGVITRHAPSGEPLLIAGIVFDISERKAFEEKQQFLIQSLSEQITLKENIFSIIMHDLRTPLSNAISFAELIKESLEPIDDPLSTYSFANIILNSGNQALSISDSLMEWTKLKNLSPENNSQITLRSKTLDVIHEFEQKLKVKKLIIKNEVPPKTIVWSNKIVLKIAIRNFLSNAIKFSHPGGTITISYQDSVLAIVDQGIGMNEQMLASMFTSSSISTSGTNQETGYGLGLTLVRELLKKTNIGFSVKSELNQGTTVELRFIPE